MRSRANSISVMSLLSSLLVCGVLWGGCGSDGDKLAVSGGKAETTQEHDLLITMQDNGKNVVAAVSDRVLIQLAGAPLDELPWSCGTRSNKLAIKKLDVEGDGELALHLFELQQHNGSVLQEHIIVCSNYRDNSPSLIVTITFGHQIIKAAEARTGAVFPVKPGEHILVQLPDEGWELEDCDLSLLDVDECIHRVDDWSDDASGTQIFYFKPSETERGMKMPITFASLDGTNKIKIHLDVADVPGVFQVLYHNPTIPAERVELPVGGVLNVMLPMPEGENPLWYEDAGTDISEIEVLNDPWTEMPEIFYGVPTTNYWLLAKKAGEYTLKFKYLLSSDDENSEDPSKAYAVQVIVH